MTQLPPQKSQGCDDSDRLILYQQGTPSTATKITTRDSQLGSSYHFYQPQCRSWQKRSFQPLFNPSNWSVRMLVRRLLLKADAIFLPHAAAHQRRTGAGMGETRRLQTWEVTLYTMFVCRCLHHILRPYLCRHACVDYYLYRHNI